MTPRAFALHSTSFQDNLLQSYRKISIFLSLAWLGLGVFCTYAVLLFLGSAYQFALMVVLAALFGMSCLTVLRMTRLIDARAKDVDYWQRRVIWLEAELPTSEREFTVFKIAQRFGLDDSERRLRTDFTPLTAQGLDEIMGQGRGLTRRVMEIFVPASTLVIWALLLTTGVMSFFV